MGPDLFSYVPTVILGDRDGQSFLRERDLARLDNAMGRIFNHMQDGKWYTLVELAEAGHCSEGSAGARFRDLAKSKFGSWKTEHRNLGGGKWIYRLCGERE